MFDFICITWSVTACSQINDDDDEFIIIFDMFDIWDIYYYYCSNQDVQSFERMQAQQRRMFTDLRRYVW